MKLLKALQRVVLAAAISAAPLGVAHASPWNVDPVTGLITAGSTSMTFTFVSRSAGFSHEFYLLGYDDSFEQLIFNAPADPVGSQMTVTGLTFGNRYWFGLYVDQLNQGWASTASYFGGNCGALGCPLADQSIKFAFSNVDDFTTRLSMEDLPNRSDPTTTCYDPTTPGWTEPCDYNDLVVDVTNTPEPATMALMATGLVGLAGAGLVRRRRS